MLKNAGIRHFLTEIDRFGRFLSQRGGVPPPVPGSFNWEGGGTPPILTQLFKNPAFFNRKKTFWQYPPWQLEFLTKSSPKVSARDFWGGLPKARFLGFDQFLTKNAKFFCDSRFVTLKKNSDRKNIPLFSIQKCKSFIQKCKMSNFFRFLVFV